MSRFEKYLLWLRVRSRAPSDAGAMLIGLAALLVGLWWVHAHHAIAELGAGTAAIASAAGGTPGFGGPPKTFLFDTWRPTSGVAVVAGTALRVTATTTTVQDLSIAGACLYQGVDCTTAFGGGGASSDPLTAAHWSSTSGVDTMTTTAVASSNLKFSGLGALAVGQLQGIGGEVALASDSGTRANTADITGTLTQTGGLAWALPGGVGNGLGVSSNKFYDATGLGAGNVVVSGADGFTEVTLATGVGANNTGILFRWSNVAASGFNLLFFSDGNYYVNRYTAGVPLTVSSGACHTAPAAGLVLRADYLGTAITISCNGAQVGSFADANYLANTRAGLTFLDGANTERFTNFSTGTGTARSLLASPLNSAQIFEESFQTWLVDHDEIVQGSSTLHAVTATQINIGSSSAITYRYSYAATLDFPLHGPLDQAFLTITGAGAQQGDHCKVTTALGSMNGTVDCDVTGAGANNIRICETCINGAAGTCNTLSQAYHVEVTNQ